MSPRDARKSAEKFLRDQAAIMKKYGKAPKLSGPTYKAALAEATKTTQSLASASKSGR